MVNLTAGKGVTLCAAGCIRTVLGGDACSQLGQMSLSCDTVRPLIAAISGSSKKELVPFLLGLHLTNSQVCNVALVVVRYLAVVSFVLYLHHFVAPVQ